MATNVDIYGRNMKISDRLHEYVTKRASRLDRYLSEIEEARIDLAYVKSARSATDRQVAQITVRGRRFILRAEERSDDAFMAFDRALDKIERQIERYKGKHYRGRGDGKTIGQAAAAVDELEEEDAQPKIVRRKRFVLIPMDEMEAIEQMQMLGHENFFIFFNANTNVINVLYQRRDGNYGLIEPEIG